MGKAMNTSFVAPPPIRYNLLDELLKEWSNCYTMSCGVQTEWAAQQLVALYIERNKLRQALIVCRQAINSPENTEAIVDTVWASEIETLQDHIDYALGVEE